MNNIMLARQSSMACNVVRLWFVELKARVPIK